MDLKLKGLSAVVTGGTRGMGRAIAGRVLAVAEALHLGGVQHVLDPPAHGVAKSQHIEPSAHFMLGPGPALPLFAWPRSRSRPCPAFGSIC